MNILATKLKDPGDYSDNGYFMWKGDLNDFLGGGGGGQNFQIAQAKNCKRERITMTQVGIGGGEEWDIKSAGEKANQ